jgi:hypothetical protein
MKNLHVFDFDGTLFRNAEDSEANRKLYEKHTGLPWIITKSMAKTLSIKHNKSIYPRSGWYGRAETLQPPFVPIPAPKEMFIEPNVKDFLDSKADEESFTVLLTGRHAGLMNSILRILHDGELVECKVKGTSYYQCDPKVTVLLLGQEGPINNYGNKPERTLPWKQWIIEQYLLKFDFQTLTIWEDRVEHVQAFNDWKLEGIDKSVRDVSTYKQS